MCRNTDGLQDDHGAPSGVPEWKSFPGVRWLYLGWRRMNAAIPGTVKATMPSLSRTGFNGNASGAAAPNRPQRPGEDPGEAGGADQPPAGLYLTPSVSWPSAASLRIKAPLRFAPTVPGHKSIGTRRLAYFLPLSGHQRHEVLTRSLSDGARGAISGRQQAAARPRRTPTKGTASMTTRAEQTYSTQSMSAPEHQK